MKNNTFRASFRPGLGLVELLMVVALLGLMTALVVPWFSGAERATQAKDKRNAQSFCSLYMAAEASGAVLAAEGRAVGDVLQALAQGVTITRGPLRGRTFRMPNLSAQDLEGAAQYLHLRDGQLIYDVTSGGRDSF